MFSARCDPRIISRVLGNDACACLPLQLPAATSDPPPPSPFLRPLPAPAVEEYAEALAFRTYLNEGRLLRQAEVELAEVEECERRAAPAAHALHAAPAALLPHPCPLAPHPRRALCCGWGWRRAVPDRAAVHAHKSHTSDSSALRVRADLGGVLDFTGELGRLAIAQATRRDEVR